MSNNPKNNSVPPDELIHDELDEANKHEYYKIVEKELKELCKEGESVNQQTVDEEMNKYVESFRNYYYTS